MNKANSSLLSKATVTIPTGHTEATVNLMTVNSQLHYQVLLLTDLRERMLVFIPLKFHQYRKHIPKRFPLTDCPSALNLPQFPSIFFTFFAFFFSWFLYLLQGRDATVITCVLLLETKKNKASSLGVVHHFSSGSILSLYSERKTYRCRGCNFSPVIKLLV